MARKALLVGCNYSNIKSEPEINKLHGCINDVNAMQALISQPCFGFQDIRILTNERATFGKIQNALNQLISGAKDGDTLLFYFSGGGALAKGIPVIVPCEDTPISPMTGEDILSILEPLPDGAFFTFICDSSYSGGLFDGNVQTISNVLDPGPKFHQKTIPSSLLKPVNVPPPPHIYNKHIILFGSSKENEESVEVYPNSDQSKAFSAFSNAIQTLLNSPEAVNPPLAGNDLGNDLEAANTNREVKKFTKGLLSFIGFDQRPYLKCSENDAAALFLGGYVA